MSVTNSVGSYVTFQARSSGNLFSASAMRSSASNVRYPNFALRRIGMHPSSATRLNARGVREYRRRMVCRSAQGRLIFAFGADGIGFALLDTPNPGWRRFVYFVYNDQIVIVDPRTMRIVNVLPV